jgi:hypothetical protein
MNFTESIIALPDRDGEEGKCGCFSAPESATKGFKLTIPSILEVDQYYTFSVYALAMIYSAIGEAKIEGISQELAKGKWTKVEITFRATQNDLVIFFNGNIRILNVYKAQLEKGRKATDYSAKIKSISDLVENNSIKNWCYNNDTTIIDGGKIATGTVTAKQIDVSKLFAENIKATGNFEIDTIRHSLDVNGNDLYERFKLINNERGIRMEASTSNELDSINEEEGTVESSFIPNAVLNMQNEQASLYGKNGASISSDSTTLSVEDGAISVTGAKWKEIIANVNNFRKFGSTSEEGIVYAKKLAGMVSVKGCLTPLNNIAGGYDSIHMFTLPKGYRPDSTLYFVCQGSGANRWLLAIGADGVCGMSRYGAGAFTTCVQGDWLPFHVTFVAKEDE